MDKGIGESGTGQRAEAPLSRRIAAGAAGGFGALTRALVALIRFYQSFSRLTPPVCRFRPTCSEYAVQALQSYGLWRGLWLALRRLGKCHPLHPGGYDPVR